MNEPIETNEPVETKGLAPELVLIAGTVVLVGAVVWWAAASRRAAEGVARGPSPGLAARPPFGYLGDQACAGCHPGESALHRQSGHSRTLHDAAETEVARRLDGRKAADPEYPGVTWSYALRDRRLSVTRAAAGAVERFIIDYAFGSGGHAVTFVSVTDRDPLHPAGLEHRLTRYTEGDALDVTPGHEKAAPVEGATPRGRPLSSAKLLRCFRCHTTVTSAASRELLDVATMVPNVTCERCHGPSRAHALAARRGGPVAAMPLGQGRSTADGLMRSCGECHRHPDQAPPDSIRTDNIEIVRHQPVGLMQSRCFKESAGGLSCLTCHDPHAPASRDAEGYVAVCLSCHSSASRTTCRVSPRTGCLECHMPGRNSGQGIRFTDHWIRVVAKAAGSAVKAGPTRTGVP